MWLLLPLVDLGGQAPDIFVSIPLQERWLVSTGVILRLISPSVISCAAVKLAARKLSVQNVRVAKAGAWITLILPTLSLWPNETRD